VVGPTAGSVDWSSRLEWSSFAMSFFDARAVVLEYKALDPKVQWTAVVVFNANAEPALNAREAGGNPNQMRLVVEGNITVWPPPPLEYSLAPAPMRKTRIPIPRAATADGELRLACEQPPGVPGNGRTCEIVEVRLVPSA